MDHGPGPDGTTAGARNLAAQVVEMRAVAVYSDLPDTVREGQVSAEDARRGDELIPIGFRHFKIGVDHPTAVVGPALRLRTDDAAGGRDAPEHVGSSGLGLLDHLQGALLLPLVVERRAPRCIRPL